jgi:hypothetical protein
MTTKQLPKRQIQFSTLELYGNRKIFENALNEGFSNVAFGSSGSWINGRKLVALFAFSNGKGDVLTYEHYIAGSNGIDHKDRSSEQRKLSAKEFDGFVGDQLLHLDNTMNLRELLDSWEKEN